MVKKSNGYEETATESKVIFEIVEHEIRTRHIINVCPSIWDTLLDDVLARTIDKSEGR